MGGLLCNHLQWGRHFAESHRTWPEGKCATGCGPSCERWSLFGPGQLGTFKRGRWPWRTTVGKSNAIAINHHFRDGSFSNLRHLDSQEQPLTLRAAYFSWAPLWTAQWLEYIPHSPMLFEDDHPKSIGFRKKNYLWLPGALVVVTPGLTGPRSTKVSPCHRYAFDHRPLEPTDFHPQVLKAQVTCGATRPEALKPMKKSVRLTIKNMFWEKVRAPMFVAFCYFKQG